MSDAPEKSEFRKLLDTHQAEREEEKFRSNVLAGLERVERDVAALREKLADLTTRKEVQHELASVKQFLTWILVFVVGGAVATWMFQNA